MPLTRLKKQVPRPAPLFDWAVGWLAREDKLVITADKRSFLLRLKHPSRRKPPVPDPAAPPSDSLTVAVRPKYGILGTAAALVMR